MKKLVLFSFIALLCSCDLYESAVPISNSENSSIDSNIVGLWQVHNNNQEPYDMYVSILPFNDREYLMEYVSWDAVNHKPSARFRARIHNSDVDFKGNTFYNIFLLDKQAWGNNRYTFFKYEALSPESLMVYSLTETKFKVEFSDSKSFNSYIKNNGPSFHSAFEEWCLLVKSKKSFLK